MRQGIALFSISLCFLGFLAGYVFGKPQFAEYGGALAVATTFGFIFLGDDMDDLVARAAPIVSEINPEPRILSADQQLYRANEEIAHLRIALRLIIEQRNSQKYSLAISSVLGTITWAFGEPISDQFLHWFS